MMRWRDLIVDAGTGQVSHTKIWANTAYAVSTAAIGWAAYGRELTGDLLLIYLGVVGASATASKFLSLKYGDKGDKTDAG